VNATGQNRELFVSIDERPVEPEAVAPPLPRAWPDRRRYDPLLTREGAPRPPSENRDSYPFFRPHGLALGFPKPPSICAL